MNRILLAAAGCLVLLSTGCASPQSMTLSAPLGPTPRKPLAAAPGGYLKVFTATELHHLGNNSDYYPHTAYRVCDARGTDLKFVRNHTGYMDEAPWLVRLPAGSYVISAESETYGRVSLPVTVEAGRTTVLHLDGAWKPPRTAPASALLRLPDGEAVGWRADSGPAPGAGGGPAR